MRQPPRDTFVEQYFDVLQNIEATIVAFYKKTPDLNDQNVNKILEGLERLYKAEESKRNPPTLKFSPLEQQLYDLVRPVCEWRLGRGENPQAGADDSQAIVPIRLDEMVACLKRSLRSVKMWNKDYGIRGYLNYITQFFPDGESAS